MNVTVRHIPRSDHPLSKKSLTKTYLTVGARDGGAAGSAGRLDLKGSTHVDDGGAGGVDGSTVLGGRGTSELERAVVGEADQGVTLLKVLDDPLGVVLAQRVDLSGEGVGHGDTGSQVLDDGSAGLQAGGSDGALDGVAGRDGDAGEVNGHVGVPLVPGRVGRGQGTLGPLDTSLEDGSG